MSKPTYALVAASFYDHDESLSLQIEFKNGRALDQLFKRGRPGRRQSQCVDRQW
jgi:hypothetical protein